jgi:hypothetical protein
VTGGAIEAYRPGKGLVQVKGREHGPEARCWKVDINHKGNDIPGPIVGLAIRNRNGEGGPRMVGSLVSKGGNIARRQDVGKWI